MDSPVPSSSPAPSAPSTTAAPSAPATPVAKAPPQPDSFKSTESSKEVKPTEAKSEAKRRLLQLKVDGKEEQLDVDSMPDEQLAIELQLAKAARKRMQEAAELKKQVSTLMEAIKKDPISALKDPAFGNLDVRKMVEDRLIEEYQNQQLPEHERKIKELEKQLESERKEKEERMRVEQEATKAKSLAELEAKTLSEIEKDFGEALESSGLPCTRETMAMMAEVQATYLDKYNITLTPAQLASEVDNRIQQQAKYVLSKLSGDSLIKYLGQDMVDAIVKHSVSSYRAKKNQSTQSQEISTDSTNTAYSVNRKDATPPKARSSLFDDNERGQEDLTRAAKKSQSFKEFAKLKRGF